MLATRLLRELERARLDGPGATLGEACRALKAAGAIRFVGLSLAQTTSNYDDLTTAQLTPLDYRARSDPITF